MSDDIPVPVVPGFTVERDVLTNEWVATSASGTYRIRGRNQWELNAARARLYARVVAEFRAAIAELFPPEWKISLRLLRSPLLPLGLRGHQGRPRLAGTGRDPAGLRRSRPLNRRVGRRGWARFIGEPHRSRPTLGGPLRRPRRDRLHRCRRGRISDWEGKMIVIDAVPHQAPSGWIRAADVIDGVPLWKRRGEHCYVATRDTDQLRFLDAALARFDQMSGPELHAFLTS